MYRTVSVRAASALVTFGLAGAAHAVPASEVGTLLVEWAGGGAAGRAALIELRELGPSAVPELFGVVTGKIALTGPDQPPPLEAAALESLATELLSGWSEEAVVAQMSGILGHTGSLDDRLIATRLLGSFGTQPALDCVFEMLDSESSTVLEHPRIAPTLSTALGAILARSPEAVQGLALRPGGIPPALLTTLVRATASQPSAVGFDLLAALLRTAPAAPGADLESAVLDALGRWPRWRPECLYGTAQALVEPFLTAPRPELRRSAAVALGGLGAIESVTRLIERLGDEDRLVQVAARRSLTRLTGRDRGADQGSWTAWYEGEWDRAQRASSEALERLESSDRAAIVRALSELGEHPLARKSTTSAIVDLVGDRDPAIAVAACAALVRLGAGEGIPELAEAATSDYARVAETAKGALTALTGLAAPASAEDWPALLGL